MTPMLTNYTATHSNHTPAHANAMAFAGIKTFDRFNGFPSSPPIMREQRRPSHLTVPGNADTGGSLMQSIQWAWQAASEWTGSVGLPGADAAKITFQKPPITVHNFIKENQKNFQIKMGLDVDKKSDLLGHAITIGIDGMPYAHKTKNIIDSLDFKRGDVVLVEGFDSHCKQWQSFGIPKENCVPLDAESPESALKLLEAEKALLDEIKSTAREVANHLPADFFDRFGYKFDTGMMHVDQMLDFISDYQSSVKPESQAHINRKVSHMEAVGEKFNAARKEIAIARQNRMANMATLYKRTDRIVVMMTDTSSAVGVAERMYRQNDIVMVDAVAANTKSSARLPQPQRERTDL